MHIVSWKYCLNVNEKKKKKTSTSACTCEYCFGRQTDDLPAKCTRIKLHWIYCIFGRFLLLLAVLFFIVNPKEWPSQWQHTTQTEIVPRIFSIQRIIVIYLLINGFRSTAKFDADYLLWRELTSGRPLPQILYPGLLRGRFTQRFAVVIVQFYLVR